MASPNAAVIRRGSSEVIVIPSVLSTLEAKSGVPSPVIEDKKGSPQVCAAFMDINYMYNAVIFVFNRIHFPKNRGATSRR